MSDEGQTTQQVLDGCFMAWLRMMVAIILLAICGWLFLTMGGI